MRISCGDKVRPNNISLGLPRATVWTVLGTADGLKLHPANTQAVFAKTRVKGLRFKPDDFEIVLDDPFVDKAREETKQAFDRAVRPPEAPDVADQADEPCRESKAVAKAREAVEQADACAALLADELAKARAAEHQRKAELRCAQLEARRKEELRKAKAQARADAQRRALQARLHADRCLGEATLELIAEVSRLHNGGPEAAAHVSIANHADQLQPLARSYGYRIVKPSMVALVVKL